MRSRASRDAFPSGAWERHRGGRALLLFVLMTIAGACVGRWTGQPCMPPRERQHEGFRFFLWCVSFPLSEHMLQEHVLAAGATARGDLIPLPRPRPVVAATQSPRGAARARRRNPRSRQRRAR